MGCSLAQQLQTSGEKCHVYIWNEINTAWRWPNLLRGCDGVGVSTVGCGPASPGSIPGHGPLYA